MNILEEKMAEFNNSNSAPKLMVYYDPRKKKQLERYNSEFQDQWQQKYDEYMEYAVTTLDRCGTIESYFGKNQSKDINTLTIVHTQFGPIKRVIYNNGDTCYEGIFEVKDEDERQVRMQYFYYYNDYNSKKSYGIVKEPEGTFVYMDKKNQFDIKHYFSDAHANAIIGNREM